MRLLHHVRPRPALFSSYRSQAHLPLSSPLQVPFTDSEISGSSLRFPLPSLGTRGRLSSSPLISSPDLPSFARSPQFHSTQSSLTLKSSHTFTSFADYRALIYRNTIEGLHVLLDLCDELEIELDPSTMVRFVQSFFHRCFMLQHRAHGGMLIPSSS